MARTPSASEIRKAKELANEAVGVSGISSLDGFPRSLEQEEDLNKTFSQVFRGPGSRKLMDYLESITIKTVAGPHNMQDRQLWHLEGQRYIVGLMAQRIERGRKE